ncbi:MAG: peptide deformylase [Synergistales bacterium]|nr:peptide deformylase [Synergistales bacterium]
MEHYTIRVYPDPVLRRETRPVMDFDQELVELARNMEEIMFANDGVGLAAPQIGLSLKLAVVFYEGVLYCLINPEIISSKGDDYMEEGCLSFPGIYGKVRRPLSVSVKSFDLDGNEQILHAEGFLARAFCHEIDHLNGKLLIDHFSPMKKSLARKKLFRLKKEKGLGEDE